MSKDNFVDMLEQYIFEKRNNHEFTMLEDNIEKLLDEYKKIKQDLKLKNDVIIELAIKGLSKDE